MVRQTQDAYSVSERRACRVLAAPRATHRSESVADDQAPLRNRMKEIAGVHVTWDTRASGSSSGGRVW